MDDVVIVYAHLVYLMSFGIFLWQIGTYIVCHLVFFPRFGMSHQGKSGNPGLRMLRLGEYFLGNCLAVFLKMVKVSGI
jgi:hypothetical protein